MKIPLFTALLLLISICLSGQNVYYVQDTAYNDKASDLNPGTDINLPWATWQKAFNTAQAGDTVFFRGGVWYPKTKASQGYTITRIDPKTGYGNNGTYSKPICFFAYPPDYKAGNYPVLDCQLASQTSTANFGLGILNATHIKFKGLIIRNVKQYTVLVCCGISGADCGNLWFENIKVHNVQGEGIWFRGYDSIYFKNCDSYKNFDPVGDEVHIAGGMGDGFLLSSRAKSSADSIKVAVLAGCRAWENSDDGFDLNVQETYIENCWSWNNGAVVGGPGGVGFKTNTGLVRIPSKKTFRNCITAYNQAGGRGGGISFTNFEEGLGTIISYYNSISFKDDRITSSFTPNDFILRNYNNVFSNNIAYQAVAPYIGSFDAAGGNYLKYPYAHLATNSFFIHPESTTGKCMQNPLFSITIDDFISLDTAQLRLPRQSDGSLPDMTFSKLTSTSDLIDAGTDFGYAFNGSAPDLGPFELNIVPGSTNKYPSVQILAPSEKSKVANLNILITAKAVDQDTGGHIDSVSFYCDGMWIGNALNGDPWSFEWKNAPLGNHSIRAVATDNNGAQSTSTRVIITIYPGGLKDNTENVLFPNPNDGSFTVFLASPLKRTSTVSILSSDGKIIYNDIFAAEESLKQYNLNWLKSGIYLFMLASSEVYFAKMFVKQ